MSVADRADPTQTKTLRRRYAQRLRGGFADINTEIRRGVRDADAFGLATDRLADPIRPGDFRFTTDDQKIERFRRWLDGQQRTEVLNTISRNGNEFIQPAYEKGARDATQRARERGIMVPDDSNLDTIFDRPVNRNAVQRLYTRNYQALQGVTDAVGRDISRALSEGFAQGLNPRTMADTLTDRIDTIGKTRATVLARTEIINAHATASLNRFEELGIDEVGIRAEWSTAGDSRVCPRCASREGDRYTIEQAKGIIPLHPRCRCTWLPITS